jgi:hypothetical protein
MKASHFSPDIQDFLFLLSAHKVRYVIVGGEAVIYHGFARLTGDVDIFFEPSAKNVQHLYRALVKFWQGSVPGLRSAQELLSPRIIIQFGVPPNRIDLVSSITGVPFRDAWTSRASEKIMMKKRICSVFFIGLDQLIKNKEALRRHKDLEDLRYLRAVAKKRNKLAGTERD